MKAAGFDPRRERLKALMREVLGPPDPPTPIEIKTSLHRETPGEWAQRMIEQSRLYRIITIDSCSGVDWEAWEKTRQHCLETERE